MLKLNEAITPSSAGVLMAISDNLFTREGTCVRLLRGNDDEEVIAAVAADQNVIGLASAAGFLKGRAEGRPIVAFSAFPISSAR